MLTSPLAVAFLFSPIALDFCYNIPTIPILLPPRYPLRLHFCYRGR
jgi:hypothetical protein